MTLHPISGKSYLLLFALLLISAFSPAQTAVPVVLAPVPQLQFFDQSGRPLSFGCVSTFQSQTTNPLATFTDFTGQFQNPNPVILSAGGSANIWLQSGQAYSLTVKSSGGTNCSLGQTLYTVDGVGGGASQLNTVVTPSGGSAAFTVQSQNQLFSLTLTGNVAGSPVSFIGVIAPALVTFQITEDGGGAHTFSWPSNVTGGAPIDTAANHTTSQTFIWNGTSILPVGSGFNSAGNSILPGNAIAALLNNIVFIDGIKYACSDVGLNAAEAALPAVGGVINAQGCSGDISGLTTTIALTKPTLLLLGASRWISSANPVISCTAPSIIRGINSLGGVSNTTIAATTSGATGVLWQCQNGGLNDLLINYQGAGSGLSLLATASISVVHNVFTNVTVVGPHASVVGSVGFNLSAFDATHLVSENTFINPISTDSATDFLLTKATTQGPTDNFFYGLNGQTFTGSPAGLGIRIASGDLNSFFGGYIDAMATAIQIDSGAQFNNFHGVRAESNTTDLTDNGTGTQFVTSSLANSSNTFNKLPAATITNLTVGSSVAADGGGFKHKRVASCTTAASGNATCATTVSWTTAFADANYTVSCTLIGNGTAFVLESGTPIAASAAVTIMNAPGSTAAASGTLDCIAVHD